MSCNHDHCRAPNHLTTSSLSETGTFSPVLSDSIPLLGKSGGICHDPKISYVILVPDTFTLVPPLLKSIRALPPYSTPSVPGPLLLFPATPRPGQRNGTAAPRGGRRGRESRVGRVSDRLLLNTELVFES